MKKLTPKVRLTTDIICAMFLLCTYLMGHADPYVHALLGMLLIVAVMVHAMRAHKKIAGMTQNLANRCVDLYTRLDCCTGFAMAVFLITALVSGAFLIKMRVAQGMSFDEVTGTVVGIVHMCLEVLFPICAVVHLMLNKEGLERIFRKRV